MWWYIGRRALQAIPVLLGSTFLIYALVFLQPGDPIAALFGEKPVSDAVSDQIAAQYNLDKPFIVQWLLYLKGILTLDFGIAYSGRPVTELLADALPVTLRLAFMALVIEAVLGIAAGFYAGLRRGKLFDSTMLVVSLVVIAIPIFVFGFFIMVTMNEMGFFEAQHRSILAGDLLKLFFAIGFAGVGLNIAFDDLKKAGGTAFMIGVVSATLKAVLAAIAVMAIGGDAFKVKG